jgi:16S rRNA U1498 N3-methylase RsmE
VCVESAEQCERLTVPGMTSNVPLDQVAGHWKESLKSIGSSSTIATAADGSSTIKSTADRSSTINPSVGQSSAIELSTPDRHRPDNQQLLVCRERFVGGESLLQVLLTRLPPSLPPVGATAVGLLVGPEGGFTQEELTYLAQGEGFRFVTLGDNVLRAETAAMAAVSTVMACQGIKLTT